MEYFQNDDLEYVLDDDYFDFEDETFGNEAPMNGKAGDSSDCEGDDEVDEVGVVRSIIFAARNQIPQPSISSYEF